jgi:hypothetical protein
MLYTNNMLVERAVFNTIMMDYVQILLQYRNVTSNELVSFIHWKKNISE